MVKILVTGASGYLGQHLVRHLNTRNFEIRALLSCRKRKLKFDPSVETVVGDILDQNLLKKICTDMRILSWELN